MDVVGLDVVSSDVNQTMLNSELHRESVCLTPMLNDSNQRLTNIGDTSWS